MTPRNFNFDAGTTGTLAGTTTFQMRRGTAAQWTAADEVLADGEPGFERDTGKLKIGDGTSLWSELDYIGA